MLILSCILLWLLLLYTTTKTKEILFVIFFSIENQRIILFFFCTEILVGIIIFTSILRNHTGLGRTRHFVTPRWFLKYFMHVSIISVCS